ncbi:conjugal transfer protein TraD [Niallia sp. MER TA 168]|uniref:conjugal transfer protein TraD n=1 Tax=Niallia sp. MER TA 168 TaxID=2939568 RepID=UPI00203C4623|nr:conjugal transfer protein TraD [Niallia sp. MER TA 168]MCM3364792.1 conjugal transfer protein TraD [Niallia sp. MER TA 168]
MARRTEEERLIDLEEKIKKMQLEKQRLANQVRQKERKERTRRLIQVGGLIEKYLEIDGEEEAIKLIAYFKEDVVKNKEKILKMDIEQARKILQINIEK